MGTAKVDQTKFYREVYLTPAPITGVLLALSDRRIGVNILVFTRLILLLTQEAWPAKFRSFNVLLDVLRLPLPPSDPLPFPFPLPLPFPGGIEEYETMFGLSI